MVVIHPPALPPLAVPLLPVSTPAPTPPRGAPGPAGFRSCFGLPHQGGNVAAAVKHSPHVDVIRLLQVEDQVRKPAHRPAPQPRDVKLIGVTGRPAPGVPAEEGAGLLQSLDEAEGG